MGSINSKFVMWTVDNKGKDNVVKCLVLHFNYLIVNIVKSFHLC